VAEARSGKAIAADRVTSEFCKLSTAFSSARVSLTAGPIRPDCDW